MRLIMSSHFLPSYRLYVKCRGHIICRKRGKEDANCLFFTLEWGNKGFPKNCPFFHHICTIPQPCINLSIPIKLRIFSSEIKGTCRSSRGVCDSAIGGLGRTADVPLLIMLHKASTQTGMFILTKS